jgi:hypothetical protein
VDPGVLLVATIRADGSPRLRPVEPLIRYAPSGDQYVARWPAREERLRRATCVGVPEAAEDLFTTE